ncbi:MAG: GspE/PulE family protein [Desulfobacterales bacterium]
MTLLNDENGAFEPKKVCQILFKRGLLTREQATAVLKKKEMIAEELMRQRRQKRTSGAAANKPLTIIDVISHLNFDRADGVRGGLEEEGVFQALAEEWGVPYKKIDPLNLDLNVVTTTIPKNFASKHLVLPIEVCDGILTVATPNPFNIEVLDDISRVCNMRTQTVVSSRTDIVKLIDEFFGFKRSIAAAENLFTGSSIDIGNLEQYVKLRSGDDLPSNDQHIVNAVNHLFLYAFDQRASDIHIEPKRDFVLVRMRIDGILHTVYRLPKKVHNAIVSRIKTLSRLNMAEKRRPQDGRIKTDKGNAEVEIRISTVPVAFGEKVVMRIMDPDILIQDLDGLGFSEDDLEKYNQFIQMPHGIILVTGPTGSGKSTTLYSTLRRVSTPENNVITVEDPIEMVHEEFNQIGVQPAVGVTFASILRTILRQDPDIIMIGEMRDLETAENAVQAALTGHLVLSTLHTNDAPTTITRLLDLGVPSFLIQATLVGIVAQRLVRVICEYCKESFFIESDELKALGIRMDSSGKIKLHRGRGCIRCRHTGYRGRIGIFEVLPYTESIKKMTTTKANVENIRVRAREEGMITLRENAVRKLLEGVTTYQEVLRVTVGKKVVVPSEFPKAKPSGSLSASSAA